MIDGIKYETSYKVDFYQRVFKKISVRERGICSSFKFPNHVGMLVEVWQNFYEQRSKTPTS